MSVVSNIKHRLDNYPKLQKTAKFVYRNAKKIRPGHIMFGAMFVMTCMSRCSTGNHATGGKNPAEYMQWAYEKGEQHVKDSIKIVELQNKIVADSLKYYHNIPKGAVK